ncbi:MAG TPA: DeoR/GlpR family DNA-binding transcription regulator [Marmoricola sp.]|nr:DeoR/GlpR family DNA-binding transcription regulator [Marmoricola sp.]
MLAARRHELILQSLSRDGIVKVSDLVERLGVSDMTIRRDLAELQSQGKLEKVHGGARLRLDPATLEPGFEAKSARRTAEKDAIATCAASLVKPGAAIAVSAGTTTHALARHLVHVPGLTVVTNSVWVADVLHRGGGEGSSVLLTGGLRTPSDALVGPLTLASLAGLNLDAFFLGVHGMDARAGLTTPNLLEAETNRAMVRGAARLIVVADSSKWGLIGMASMAALDEVDVLVTDTGLSSTAAAELRDHVDELVLVDAGAAVRQHDN